MALVNCESSNGYLEATANGGYGISEVESANGKTIVNIRNVLTTWEATTNINQSTEDGVLSPIIPLQKGDSVAIVDAGEIVKYQLHKGIVSGLPVIDTDDCDNPQIIESGSLGADACGSKAYDGNTSTNWVDKKTDTHLEVWLGWDFQIRRTVSSYTVGAKGDSSSYLKKWQLQGSDDLQNWAILDEREDELNFGAVKTFDLAEQANYRYYRVFALESNYEPYYHITILDFIGESNSIFDVSDVQSGAVTAYSLSDRVYFRGENTDDIFYTSSSVSIDENSLNYDNTVPKLQYQSLQKRVAVPECTEIVSKYELSVTGQKMIESSFDIYVDEE